MNPYEEDPGWQYLRLSREIMLKETSRPYNLKKNVWIADPEDGYASADIVSTKGDMVTLMVKGHEKTVKKDLIQEMNPPKFEKAEDMSNLSFLNDASVLHNLRSRYSSMLIYTYSGLFCVVINPYKRLPIYTSSVARMFIGKRRTEMPPHLFAVSDEAFRNMLQNRENQSMLITGESGAGKTENTKKVIAYFASVGASQQETVTDPSKKSVTLEDQIVQTNPVLEAFGNAKTVRNNNSSRFGKFIRIHFNKAGRVASCDIEHYLLEKSRVIRQAPGERCYHIFYQIFSGYIPDLLEKLSLSKPLKDYWFVAQAELIIDGIDDKEEFMLTDEAFDVLNFSAEEKFDCYKLMSGIMHMGNMKFKQRPREEQAEPDERDEANFAAEMFSIETDAFLNALVKPRVRVGNEWVSKGQSVEQVHWSIGAMAKGLFARVFDWLVKKCNMTLDQKGLSRDYFIGVLDIAGFEIFDFNSFEQLWINFVNEKLQQFFNHHMFVLEQEEYAREGIQWTFIDFGLDLQACIELIEKPMGIISMLDEECIVPKASDNSLAQKLLEQHLGKHPNFEKPKPPKGKQADAHFSMRHYAGTVRYNVSNWLEKNKDPLNDTLISVMKHGKGNALLLEVWSNYQTQEDVVSGGKGSGAKKKGKSGSFMTVSNLYRESLNKLMTMLHKTHPHFIRCIIPNEKKASGVIDAALVLNQLTCNGVLEGIRICRKGFPNRMLHSDFRQRYAILAAKEASSASDAKAATAAILNAMVNKKNMTDEQFKVGHTKVFFKAGILALVEELRENQLNGLIAGIQAAVRYNNTKVEMIHRKKAQDAYTILQKNIRSWCVLRTWEWYNLYGKIKPMFKSKKHAEEMERLEIELKSLEENFAKEEEQRKVIEAKCETLTKDRNKLLGDLNAVRSGENVVENEINALASAKVELEKRLNNLKDKLHDQEHCVDETQRLLNRAEKERDTLNEQIGSLDENLERVEQEKLELEKIIHQMNNETILQDEAIINANREKKRLEEENFKQSENVQIEIERSSQVTRSKIKLERAIEDVEDSVDRERRQRIEIEKIRKKLGSELNNVQEQINEVQKWKDEADDRQKNIDEEVRQLTIKLDQENDTTGKSQRKIRKNNDRIMDLEEELETERHARAKIDKSRSNIQVQLDGLNDSIDEANSKSSEIIELGKKKDVEYARLHHDLQIQNQDMANNLTAIRKRFNDETIHLNEQFESLQATMKKTEKEKEAVSQQLNDIIMQISEESKIRADKERFVKNVEIQVSELQTKCDEQHKYIQDLTASKILLQSQNMETEQRIEEMTLRLTQTSKSKAQGQAQLEEARQILQEERQERQELTSVIKSYEHEIEQIRDSIEDEVLQKEELLKQISRTKAEAQQWKAKFEGEGLIAADDLEEERRRRVTKKLEIQNAIAETTSKIMNCEKTISKMMMETEQAQAEIEQNRILISQLELKQTSFEKSIEDWHQQCDNLSAEIERNQNDCRRNTSEVFLLQNAQTVLNEQADELKRNNKTLSNELRDLQEQFSVTTRNSHDVAKKVRILELEKEDLQHALDEAEAALEIEEGKVMRVQTEVSQIRADIDRRISEKEEDFENTLKNHQRAVDSIRASLNSESKSRAVIALQKQKLEEDLNGFELSLDLANKTNVDSQKQLKKFQMQIQELQLQLEEEQRRREEYREQYLTTERNLNIAIAEKQEIETQREQVDAQKHRVEADLAKQLSQKNEYTTESTQLFAARRTAENDLQITKGELDKTLTELKHLEENFKKVNTDVTRLSDELIQEQQHHEYIDKLRKGLELQTKELQARFEQAESQAQRVGQRAVEKIQECIRSREQEFEIEQKRHKEYLKQLSKYEREIRERSFDLDEHKKSSAKMQELIEKLQNKIKVYKKQLEEAEEVATMNQQKYRQIQSALDHTEERADEAENSLIRMKTKMRGSTAGLTPSGSLMHSATTGGSRGGLNLPFPLNSRGYSHLDDVSNGAAKAVSSPMVKSSLYHSASSAAFRNLNRGALPHSLSYSHY